MDKKKRQDELQYDDDGAMEVHQQITESYQSGVIDGRFEEQRKKQSEKED